MCHLALFMPVFAVPIFWLLPWPIATAIYVAILVLSAWLYYLVIKIMHRPSRIGLQTLMDARGTVIRSHGSCGLARIGRELWQIRAEVPLKEDEKIKVTGRHGFVLDVTHSRPKGNGLKEP